MKSQTLTAVSAAVLSLTLAYPAMAQSLGQSNMQPSQASAPAPGMDEAARMVPAQAILKHDLDAHRTANGYEFRAVLSETVHLSNGTVLPAGSQLLGTVTNDDMNLAGNAKLALRFDQVVLHNGQELPIKATIVAAYRPSTITKDEETLGPGGLVPNSWTANILSIHQIGVASGVELRSRIAGANSGVFVANRARDIKLPAGSEFALAIAPDTNQPRPNMNAMGNGR